MKTLANKDTSGKWDNLISNCTLQQNMTQTSALQISLGLTLPQALQWCRLRVRLKSEVQFMHIITWDTGTRTGAASPRAIHSFSRAFSTNIKPEWIVHSPLCLHYSLCINRLVSVSLTSLQGPPNVQSPAAWSARARLSVWNQSSLSPTEL